MPYWSNPTLTETKKTLFPKVLDMERIKQRFQNGFPKHNGICVYILYSENYTNVKGRKETEN